MSVEYYNKYTEEELYTLLIEDAIDEAIRNLGRKKTNELIDNARNTLRSTSVDNAKRIQDVAANLRNRI
jgi:hypothetical protein